MDVKGRELETWKSLDDITGDDFVNFWASERQHQALFAHSFWYAHLTLLVKDILSTTILDRIWQGAVCWRIIDVLWYYA